MSANKKLPPSRPPTQLSSAPSSPFFFLGGEHKQSIASFRPSHTRLSTAASRLRSTSISSLTFAGIVRNITLEGQGASHGRSPVSISSADPFTRVAPNRSAHRPPPLPPQKFHQKIFHQHFSSNTSRNLPSLLSYSYWTKRVFYILKPKAQKRKKFDTLDHIVCFFSNKKLIKWPFF